VDKELIDWYKRRTVPRVFKGVKVAIPVSGERVELTEDYQPRRKNKMRRVGAQGVVFDTVPYTDGGGAWVVVTFDDQAPGLGLAVPSEILKTV
jgi:hypothetical protein